MEGIQIQELIGKKDKKPVVYSSDKCLVSQWKAIWDEILYSIGPMMEDKEDWIYLHHGETLRLGHPLFMLGKDEEILEEFKRFESLGLIKVDNDEINNQKIFLMFLKKSNNLFYRADLTFHTYVSPDGGPLCPILFGANALATGLTYVNVKFRLCNRKEREIIAKDTIMKASILRNKK